MTVEEFVINKEQLAEAVKYSLCMKRTHPNSDKLYPYIRYPGGKWECVTQDRQEYVLAKWEEKKSLKADRRRMNAELKAMTSAERREFNRQAKLFSIIYSITWEVPYNQMADGSTRDSKSEVILSCVAELLDVKYVYHPPYRAMGWLYEPDFVVGSLVWEHRGVFGDPDYESRHRNKIHDYKEDQVNYLLTEDHRVPSNGNKGYLKIPEILWAMVKSGMVTAAKVLKTFYPGR